MTPEPLRRTRWRQRAPGAARTRIVDAVHHTADGDRIGLGSRLDGHEDTPAVEPGALPAATPGGPW